MLAFSEVKGLFEASGISVAEWSREHGFPSALVYRVLRGEAKCRRGETHKIAIALGIKKPATLEQLEQLEKIKRANDANRRD